MISPESIDVVILCGGLGTRLRDSVNDRPKVMALVNGRPFLDILIEYIAGYRFNRFILCVGYMKNIIKEYYQNREDRVLLFSEEHQPLGTAGAVKNAEAFIKSDPLLVLNGDSFCNINLEDFLQFHLIKKALLSIALVPPEKDTDYGVVTVDMDQRIVSFHEKAKPDTNGFISAGIYFFNKSILELIPANVNYSLEYDLFPKIIDKGGYGYITKERLIDIGTPERYKTAERFLRNGR